MPRGKSAYNEFVKSKKGAGPKGAAFIKQCAEEWGAMKKKDVEPKDAFKMEPAKMKRIHR